MTNTTKQNQNISTQETRAKGLVDFWNEIMVKAKKGSPVYRTMLKTAEPEVRQAYAAVYGENVVPFFVAKRRSAA